MVIAWKSKGLSRKSIKPPATSDNSLDTGMNYIDNVKLQLKFVESCLKQKKVFNHNTVVNLLYCS